MAEADPPRPAAPGPTTAGPNDPDAAEVLPWADMPPEARAAACLAALNGGLPLETGKMRWNPQTRVAFALAPGLYDRTRRRVLMELVPRDRPGRPALLEVIYAIRARHGNAAVQVEALIKPTKRKWFTR